MRLVYNLNNLNRTADFLVQKNGITRCRDDNPIRFVIKQLAAAVEARVPHCSLAQLRDDALKNVMYEIDGQSQVCFCLGITDQNGRRVDANLQRHNDPYDQEDRYWTKQLAEVSPELTGHTAVVYFYVQLGNEPRNLGPDDLSDD